MQRTVLILSSQVPNYSYKVNKQRLIENTGNKLSSTSQYVRRRARGGGAGKSIQPHPLQQWPLCVVCQLDQ